MNRKVKDVRKMETANAKYKTEKFQTPTACVSIISYCGHVSLTLMLF